MAHGHTYDFDHEIYVQCLDLKYSRTLQGAAQLGHLHGPRLLPTSYIGRTLWAFGSGRHLSGLHSLGSYLQSVGVPLSWAMAMGFTTWAATSLGHHILGFYIKFL
ncbi:hypothetical protein Salat_0087800 [Sesamum alatum]|uniref:Uncharacterized protein n=1 Tax=Sesamum alatum TaxID=300844 RepID=A0AAE2CXC0_9LAMI|nr:hypothetical protein Salat_0087800 [Sesamum alatum]